jgi:arsenite methyltransferase
MRFWRILSNIGAHLLGEIEIGDILEDHGFASVRTKNFGTLQRVRAKRG